VLRHSRKRLDPVVRLVRTRPREAMVGVGIAVVGIAAIAGVAASTPTVDEIRGAPAGAAGPPAPPPMLVRNVAPEQALAINAAIPLASGPNPAAKPFIFANADKAAQGRALECLTSAVYYEAGQEPTDGQRAVAQVILNRVRHPAFPASVCGVVYEGSTRATGCQFTFTCDGSLMRRPMADSWRRAREVAEAALTGFVYQPVGNATHYHANYVVPYWAPTLTKNAVIGAHIFYRWAGGWGLPGAFSQRYARSEPNVDALRSAALVAEERDRQQRALNPQGDVAEAIAEIPGAEAIKLAPSMRGDSRVAVRFNLTAREAAEKAPREVYVEKVAASNNLRWTLTGDAVASGQQALGKKAEPAKPSGATAAGAGAATAAPAGASVATNVVPTP
jgi:spore germination cell wall hydrolase CwlJ-like protein